MIYLHLASVVAACVVLWGLVASVIGDETDDKILGFGLLQMFVLFCTGLWSL